jgi:hypothetical protein
MPPYTFRVDFFAEIRRAAERRTKRRSAYELADEELRRLIREGFESGLPADKIAEASGLSVPRVYQIRDGRR